MHALTWRNCSSLWNARVLMSANGLPKLAGYHSNIPWAIAKDMSTLSFPSMYLLSVKIWLRLVYHILRYLARYAIFCPVVAKISNSTF